MPQSHSKDHGVSRKGSSDRASAPRVRTRSRTVRDRAKAKADSGRRARLLFPDGQPADVVVVFGLRRVGEQTDVVRHIAPPTDIGVLNYKGSGVFDLTDEQKDAIREALESDKPPGMLEEFERLVDVGNRIAPKVSSLLGMFKKRGPEQ